MRKLFPDEERLLLHLIKNASVTFNEKWNERLLVKPMDDGGMGSLLFFPNGKFDTNRSFGKCVSENQFKDADNVEVIASLNVDSKGNLFELDIWKTDFSPLIKIPEKF
ncbi:MAG: hypothetical protein JWO92_1685 [Chitinophagaceae bacterium]|nr:hypothetical protein [Chitinophagaceae bacterium]